MKCHVQMCTDRSEGYDNFHVALEALRNRTSGSSCCFKLPELVLNKVMKKLRPKLYELEHVESMLCKLLFGD
jgi:non-canonical (house-cleaning) NTP pyrophosphatase